MQGSEQDEAPETGGRPAAASGMRAILTKSSVYLFGSIINRAVGFLFIPFYAHYLSPAEYGLAELVELSTQTIAISLGLQAIGLAMTRLFYDQPTAETQAAIVSTAIIATGVLSGVVAAAAVALAGPLSELVFHTGAWAGLLRAAFVAMFLSNMLEVVLVYERIRDRATFFLLYTTASLLASTGLNIVFIGMLGAGVWGFVITKLVTCCVGSLYLLVRVFREVGWRWRPAFLPEFVRLAVPLTVSALAFFVFHFSDRFFLTGWVSLADLGRYSLAYKLAMLVSVLVGDAFAKSWEATLFRYIGQEGWQARFASVASFLTMALFATGLGIALFSPALMRAMVPSDYLPPPLVIPVIVLSYIAREIGDFFRTLLLINKRAAVASQISVAGAVVNIGANLVLIPALGIMGAAWATLLTWVAYMAGCWVVANREHRLPMRTAAYGWITALSVAFYVAAGGMDLGNVVLQFLGDGAVVLVFIAVAGASFLSRGERAAAGEALRPLLRRGNRI